MPGQQWRRMFILFYLYKNKIYYQATEHKNDNFPGISLLSQKNLLVYLAHEQNKIIANLKTQVLCISKELKCQFSLAHPPALVPLSFMKLMNQSFSLGVGNTAKQNSSTLSESVKKYDFYGKLSLVIPVVIILDNCIYS